MERDDGAAKVELVVRDRKPDPDRPRRADRGPSSRTSFFPRCAFFGSDRGAVLRCCYFLFPFSLGMSNMIALLMLLESRVQLP